MNPPRNPCDVYEAFKANKDKLADLEWLTEFLRPHCRLRRMHWRGSRVRIIQFPSELARFLQLLAANKVTSYLEIGISTGGTFFTVDSYLRLTVPTYARSVGYDRTNKIRGYNDYRKLVGDSIEFRHQNSRDMKLEGERFDAAFIDARHIKKWVLQDFEKVRHDARIVSFHDIVLSGSTVGEAWNQIKDGKRSIEIIDTTIAPDCRCGIGVVWNE